MHLVIKLKILVFCYNVEVHGSNKGALQLLQQDTEL